MKSRLSLSYFLRFVIIVVMASSLSLQTAFAQTASPPQNSTDTPTTDEAFSAPTPEKSAESGSTKTWLLVGGAVAIGLGAVALGSGGGGGDGSTATEPVVEETQSTSSSNDDDDDKDDDDDDEEEIEIEEDGPYSGPDLNGSWSGFVNLVNKGNENVSVSASVSQDGEDISISTSSPYSYARSFSGKISSSGNIKVKDGNTGEIWTTHSGAATTSSIRLFDWVNDFTDLDRLELSR